MSIRNRIRTSERGTGNTIVNIISGISNWIARSKPAILFGMGPASLRIATEKPATRFLQGASTLRIATEKPATAFSWRGIVGTLGRAVAKPASLFSFGPSSMRAATEKPATKFSQGSATLRAANEKPATQIARINIDLAMQRYVATAAVDAGATGTWNNPNNIVGAQNGTVATFNGGLVLGTGNLRELTWATFGARPTTLIIDQVYLSFYYQTAGLPIVSDLISNLTLAYRINTSPLATTDGTVATVTSNDNYLAAGREFRIDDGAGNFVGPIPTTAVTWANLALLQAAYKATTIANGLMSYSADAIRLRVVAHEVWLP